MKDIFFHLAFGSILYGAILLVPAGLWCLFVSTEEGFKDFRGMGIVITIIGLVFWAAGFFMSLASITPPNP